MYRRRRSYRMRRGSRRRGYRPYRARRRGSRSIRRRRIGFRM